MGWYQNKQIGLEAIFKWYHCTANKTKTTTTPTATTATHIWKWNEFQKWQSICAMLKSSYTTIWFGWRSEQRKFGLFSLVLWPFLLWTKCLSGARENQQWILYQCIWLIIFIFDIFGQFHESFIKLSNADVGRNSPAASQFHPSYPTTTKNCKHTSFP